MGCVLIVDDSLFMRHLYKTMLGKNGIDVIGEASNGFEAIAQYTELKPDVVVMDINMPGLSGMQALEEILSQDKDAKIIISSAMGQEAFVRDSILGGAKAFVVKPIVEKIFIDTIRRVLKS